MKNEYIIMLESIRLMEAGIIGGSGEMVTVTYTDGTTKQVEMPEPIHTYQRWKAMGYQVQKGQKAIAQFTIWKYTAAKKSTESEEEAQAAGHCFMKLSSFFKMSQVEKIDK